FWEGFRQYVSKFGELENVIMVMKDPVAKQHIGIGVEIYKNAGSAARRRLSKNFNRSKTVADIGYQYDTISTSNKANLSSIGLGHGRA
ncbi:hypothetical protein SO802_022557, partial [Lithocarpus litseifolius]